MSPTAFTIVDRPRFDIAWPLARFAGNAASAEAGTSNRRFEVVDIDARRIDMILVQRQPNH